MTTQGISFGTILNNITLKLVSWYPFQLKNILLNYSKQRNAKTNSLIFWNHSKQHNTKTELSAFQFLGILKLF